MNPSDGSHGTKVQDSLFEESQLNAVSNTGALVPAGTLDGDASASMRSEEAALNQQFRGQETAKNRRRMLRFAALGLLLLAGLGLVGVRQLHGGNTGKTAQADASLRYHNVSIPLADLTADSPALSVQKAQTLSVNGQLNVNNSLVLAPTTRPDGAVTGQLYFDQTTNQLAYYNGTSFQNLLSGALPPSTTIDGASGNIATGSGLAVAAGTLSNTGVLTLQGQAGNITLAAGPGIVVNGTTLSNSGLLSLGGQSGEITLGSGLSITGNQLHNTGVISAVGAGSITVTNDGNGNITIDGPGGSGSGTVSSPGGTTGKIAKFTGVQTIADSLISDNGAVVTVSGDLSVTGNLLLANPLPLASGGTGANNATNARANLGAAKNGANNDITSINGLTTALSVSQGGTGVGTLATNGVIIGNGTSPLTSVVAGSAGECLVSTAGAPVWSPCPGTSGVASLNGGNGALTLNNASLSGSTITIDDATTSTKGIASFNGTNFLVTSGAVNTIQDINTTAAPTFGQLMLTSNQASNPMFVVNNTNLVASGALLDLQLNGMSKFSVSPAGNITAAGTLNGQTISSAANFTGSVTVGSTLSVNTITPTSSLTIGASGQSFLLQGNASSSFKASNGGSSTTVGFQTPTANVTYSFPAAAAGAYSICTTAGNCTGVGGGVTSPGGTANTIAKFTASGTIGNSSITDNGATVTVAGALSVNTLTPTAALTVGSTDQNLTLQGATVNLSTTSGGLTNNLTFATPAGSNKTITLPNASGTVAVSASGPLALDSAGNLTCPTCLTSGGGGGGTAGVTSVNGLTGALNINNTSGTGTTITIDDASTSTKGIASFNGTNFQASGGVINTIQDIATTSAPTFGQLTVTSSQAANAMLVINNTNAGATGNLIDLQLNGGSKFRVAPNGNTTIAGTLAVNTITPSGSLTVGATAQSFTLQGNASSTITATGGGQTTTVGFTGTPVGAVTFNFDRAAAAGTYTICTTAGNCAGVGGGVTTPGGTTNRIAKFTGSGTVANSSLTDDGSNITLDTNVGLVLQGGSAKISSAIAVSGSNGSDLTIVAGAGNGTNKNGGNLLLQGGASTGTGTPGSVIARSTSNSTTAFLIQNSSNSNIFQADTTNNRVGINTSGTPTSTLEVTGTVRIDGTITESFAAKTGNVSTRINLPFVTLTAPGSQVIALGVDSGSDASARGISVFDARTGTHQPSIAVLSPDESKLFGLSWDGSNSLPLVKTTTGQLGFSLGGGTPVYIDNTGAGVAQLVIGISGPSGKDGELTFSNAANSNQVSIRTGTTSSNYALQLPAGIGSSGQCLNVASVVSTTATLGYTSCGNNNAFIQGGNSLGAAAVLGTTDSNSLNFVTNGSTQATIAVGGATTFKNSTNSATAFRIQDASAASLLTADTTARSASGGNLIKIGDSTGTDGSLTILKLDSATTDPTSNLSALNGGLFYNSTTNKVSLIENGQVKIICNTTDLGCGTGTVTLQNAYANSIGGTTPEILLDATRKGLDIQDANSTIGASQALLAVRGSATSTTLGTAYLQVLGDGRVGVNGTAANYQMNITGNGNNMGALYLQGGAGSNGTSGGDGGNALTAIGGDGGSSSAAGSLAGNGGGISLTGGNGGLSSLNHGGTGGNITITGGNGGDSNSGNANYGGYGGSITLQAGTGGGGAPALGGGGGTVNIYGGNGGPFMNGGAVTIRGGNPGTFGTTYGSINLWGDSTIVQGASTTAFQVQTQSSVNLFTVDAVNERIIIGPTAGDTTGAILVLGSKTNTGDPAGVNGAIYYNAALGVNRCYMDGYWRDCSQNVRTTFYALEDDMGYPDSDHALNGQWSTISYGGSPSYTQAPAQANHPGIGVLNTGTGTSDGQDIELRSLNDDAILLGNGQTWRYEAEVELPTLSGVSSQTFQNRLGFTDEATEDPDDGCVFYYSDSVNGGRWQGMCQAADGGLHVCDTGVTVAASTWYRMTIVVNSAGTQANFQINGVSKCQVTSGIPTGATQQTSALAIIHKTGGTTSRSMLIDYIEVRGDLGTAR